MVRGFCFSGPCDDPGAGCGAIPGGHRKLGPGLPHCISDIYQPRSMVRQFGGSRGLFSASSWQQTTAKSVRGFGGTEQGAFGCSAIRWFGSSRGRSGRRFGNATSKAQSPAGSGQEQRERQLGARLRLIVSGVEPPNPEELLAGKPLGWIGGARKLSAVRAARM